MDRLKQMIIVSDSIRCRVQTQDAGLRLTYSGDIPSSVLEYREQFENKRALPPVFVVQPGEIFNVRSLVPNQLWERICSMVVLLLESESGLSPELEDEEFADIRFTSISSKELEYLAKRTFSQAEWKIRQYIKDQKYKFAIRDSRNDQQSLIDIGKALSLEKDPDNLLRLILRLSKKITGADAGSIFILEGDEKKVLRFKYSHTFSKELAYEEFTLPLDTSSIAGYVAVTGEVLNIPDVYHLDKDAPVVFNPSFDQTHGYRTRSMLVVPMRNHLDEVIGVIQLINSKESEESRTGNEAFEIRLSSEKDFDTLVKPFKQRYQGLMEAVAGQAAISIENNRMLKQIEQQFDEFVKASVTAIESRDPATSGHSFRVASMCVRMAEAINRDTDGDFRDIHLSDSALKEFECAGLLHDFGKVYIDPNIFLKEKKLFSWDFHSLLLRLRFLYRSIELAYEKKMAALSAGDADEKAAFEQDKLTMLATLRDIMTRVSELNEPSVGKKDPAAEIESILKQAEPLNGVDLDGKPIPILTRKEIFNLSILRGSLNEKERKIIESHVNHTYAFVSKIPWPDEYRHIPEIAITHHEKLDGSGYPRGISGKENIPVQSRIIVIADIFDALNASDRPYKQSIPLERVFAILREEAAMGKLDGQLVELFIREKVWE